MVYRICSTIICAKHGLRINLHDYWHGHNPSDHTCWIFNTCKRPKQNTWRPPMNHFFGFCKFNKKTSLTAKDGSSTLMLCYLIKKFLYKQRVPCQRSKLQSCARSSEINIAAQLDENIKLALTRDMWSSCSRGYSISFVLLHIAFDLFTQFWILVLLV